MSLINLKWDKEKDNIKSWALTPHHNTYIEDKANERSMIEKEKRSNEKNDIYISLDGYFHEIEETMCINFNSETTRGMTDPLEIKLTEMILGIDHINNSSEYGIKDNASTITLCSGKNEEDEEYRYSIDIEEFYLYDNTSTLEFHFHSYFLEKDYKISTVCSYNQQFHGIEISIDMIDVNHVYPPIGPPL